MNVEKIIVDRAKARELYRAYKKHQHYSAPIDQEIMRTYQRLAQGRTVIRALDSIKASGLGEDGFPKLALCRADAKECHVEMMNDGGARMWMDERWEPRAASKRVRLPADSFPHPKVSWRSAVGVVPLIPIHLRPKRGLANYHILWEAEWTRIPPRDPYLLRRIGGDLWLVVAAWDLTEVERAAMATRMVA